MKKHPLETNTPHFMIRNSSLRLKRELIRIAGYHGKTVSQYCRELIIKARNDATEKEINYTADDAPC